MAKILRNGDVFQLIEKWAPKHLAYNWDNVGLQIGSYTDQVEKIMITLDVLESVVDEAIENNINLIIAHHPLLFKPLKQINVNQPIGRIIQKLIKNNITVYAAHTNLDAANGGVNDILCDILGINNRETLLDAHFTEKLFKISVFVPEKHKDDVQKALNESGAGHIGNYSHCTFSTTGVGTFMPLAGTNPYIGNENKLEKVDEVKIETIVSELLLSDVIEMMVKAHPYEEVAYDIYPIENTGDAYGVGRIGDLDACISLKALCDRVKTVFDVPHVRVTGDLTKNVQKIAVLGGSGEKYFRDALKKGADVYITGDMTFHNAQDAWQAGLSVIDPGHHVEKVMKKATKDYLMKNITDDTIEIMISKVNTEPFHFA